MGVYFGHLPVPSVSRIERFHCITLGLCTFWTPEMGVYFGHPPVPSVSRIERFHCITLGLCTFWTPEMGVYFGHPPVPSVSRNRGSTLYHSAPINISVSPVRCSSAIGQFYDNVMACVADISLRTQVIITYPLLRKLESVKNFIRQILTYNIFCQLNLFLPIILVH